MNTCSQPRCGKNHSYSTSSAYNRTGKNARDTWCLDNFALAMAYVPMQQFQSLYEPNEALQCGAIFPELNKPFLGWKGGRSC